MPTSRQHVGVLDNHQKVSSSPSSLSFLSHKVEKNGKDTKLAPPPLKKKMKLLTLLSLLSVATAFGVSPRPISQQKTVDLTKSAFRKDSVVNTPLFRDPTKVRGGAVPGWAAYNEALDKHPLTAKSCTSLVGWALGDLLAQVRLFLMFLLYMMTIRHEFRPGCMS